MNWLRALAGFAPLIARGVGRIVERRRIKRIARRYDAIVAALGEYEFVTATIARRLRVTVPEAERWLALAEASGVVVSRPRGLTRAYRVRPVDA